MTRVCGLVGAPDAAPLSLSVSERAHSTRKGKQVLWHFRNSENATVATSEFRDDELASKTSDLAPEWWTQILVD